MNHSRRKFLLSSAALGAVVFVQANPIFRHVLQFKLKRNELAALSDELEDSFMDLLKWMKKEGWVTYLNTAVGINIDPENPNLHQELFRPIDPQKLKSIAGLDDFGGTQGIEPGFPALSLLYHIMASPRVLVQNKKGDSVLQENYPCPLQIDTLENCIYGLRKISEDKVGQNHILAVFAYEYRPAYKTPHKAHADLVFSRTGIARVGDRKMNYDRVRRCYINEPAIASDQKHMAVTPSRYGIFLAEMVQVKNKSEDAIKVLNMEDNDDTRYFLRPIRKIFKDTWTNIEFSEYHLNEKLGAFHSFQPENDGKTIDIPQSFDALQPPFVKVSRSNTKIKLQDHNSDMVELKESGSSVLLSSIPAPLVQPAVQNGNLIRFLVPVKWDNAFEGNRRYTSFKAIHKKTRDIVDVIITEFFYRGKRRTTRLSEPRNAPMFVNIRNKVTDDNWNKPKHLGPDSVDFDHKKFSSTINAGGYWAPLFEDNICDGCVTANISIISSKIEQQELIPFFEAIGALQVLPAFSLVLAPDFFPFADGYDIHYFDSRDKNFLEGNTINLSGIRNIGNQRLKNPINDKLAFPKILTDATDIESNACDTITAVITNNANKIGTSFTNPNERNYQSASFLPDTASGIFYPGWDITYSGERKYTYFSTVGLGSPFPEDMKLCAAANGMWPASSPDAARTFMGSLDTTPTIHGGRRNGSAVPLMDNEIGYHKESFAVKNGIIKESFGWDGEQGPFLEYFKNDIYVNFTDAGTSDYVKNALEDMFDMSNLRKLSSADLIFRMDCLRKCIRAIDGTKPEFTKLWLITAEHTKEWNDGVFGYGAPTNIFENIKGITSPQLGISGKGFLFIFGEAVHEGKKECIKWVDDSGCRRRQRCKRLFVCQVTEGQVSWFEFRNGLITDDINWNSA